MFRKRVAFDAILVISEICAIVSSFYLGYVLFVLVADWVFQIPYTSQQVINSAVFKVSTKFGLISIFGELFGGIVCSLLYVFLEGRYRKALDFISTTFVIHLLVVTLLSGFPKSACWWLFTFLFFILTTVFAGRISMNYEMQDINLAAMFPSAFK